MTEIVILSELAAETIAAKTVSANRSHKPRLDGLRAVAVGFVLLTHFMPSVERWLPGGNVGVRIFFVLSGYLISGILLELRDTIDNHRGLSGALRTFYGRRALRILPVYSGALILALGLGSLLAYYEHTGAIPYRRALGRFGAIGLTLAAVFCIGKMLLPGRAAVFQCYEITLAFGGTFLVNNALKEDRTLWGRLLENPFIRYVGRISYGIYALHMVVYGGVASLIAGVGIGSAVEKVARIMLELPISLALPMLSYHLLELPLGRLKRFLPYPLVHSPTARVQLGTLAGATVEPAAE